MRFFVVRRERDQLQSTVRVAIVAAKIRGKTEFSARVAAKSIDFGRRRGHNAHRSSNSGLDRGQNASQNA